jgi:hypothetical protein
VDNRKLLYHARINRHLTLEQVGARTALSPPVLRNIDEGRFELLPSGLYARSYVRSFAGAVGLDSEEALAEVEHLLPDAPDPIPALNAVRGITSVFSRIEPWPAVASERFGQWQAAALNRAAECRSRVLNHALSPQLTRCGAAAIDALLLVAVDTLLVLLVSWSSGIGFERLLQEAGWALSSFCAIPIALYFLLFGGIAGSTLGRSVCSLIDPTPPHRLTLPDILRRAVRH